MSAETEPFGRQPQPVEILIIGDDRDVAQYRDKISRYLERNTYDHVVVVGVDRLKIYPAAVND